MIYLDTNAFYFFFFWDKKISPRVKKVFMRMQKGEEIGITSSITLDELTYVTLMRLLEKKYKRHPVSILREKPSAMLEFVSKIEKMLDVIFSMKNLKIEELSVKIVRTIPFLMERYLLLPTDCIHIQTMKEVGCVRILSTDPDFDRVDWIERIKPEKIR